MAPSSNSIVEILYRHARLHSDKPCVIERHRRWTYEDFWRLVYGLSRFFFDGIINQGDRVVVEASHTATYLAVELGLHLAGGVFVPIEKNSNPEIKMSMAEQVGAALIVTRADFPSEMPVINFDVLDKYAWRGEFPENIEFPDGEILSDILFTTGTTGKTKGVEVTHASAVAVAENVKYGVEMESDNIELIITPLNHFYGVRRFYGNISNGSAIALLDGTSFVGRVFDMIENMGVNSMALVPTTLNMLLKLTGDRIGIYRDKIRYIQVGTAPLSEELKKKLCQLLPQSRLYNFYGCSEAGCTLITDYNSEIHRPCCLGKPTHNTAVAFFDSEGKQVIPTEDKPGYLAVTGTMCTRGYWNAPDLTAKVFKNGYVVSNDLTYQDEEGYIYFIGRQDDVINIGGNKVSPDEIENKAMLLDDLEDCCCVGVPDVLAGESIKLFVVMAKDKPFSPVKIRDHIAKHVDSFKLPKMIVEIDSIPRTFNGKVQRRKLKNQ